jgi:hypothetical protein
MRLGVVLGWIVLSTMACGDGGGGSNPPAAADGELSAMVGPAGGVLRGAARRDQPSKAWC